MKSKKDIQPSLPKTNYHHFPSARAVAQLIQTGTPHSPQPEFISPWDTFYRAAAIAPGDSQETRMEAFKTSAQSHPHYSSFLYMVEDALKILESGEDLSPNWEDRVSAHFYPDIYGAAYALQPHPPIRWLIEEFISRPSLTLIVGASGVKKTYAMLDLALSVALGQPWLGRPVDQAPVFWIDEEGGQRRIFKRFAQSMRAHGADEDVPISIMPNQNFDLFNPFHTEALTDHIKYDQTGLIVIDPFTALVADYDENTRMHVIPAFNALRDLSRLTNAAIILIHHTNKAGLYRGSTYLRNTVDLMLTVESPIYTPFLEFKSIKARDTPPIHFAAQIHFDPPDAEPQRVHLTPAELSHAQFALRTGLTPSPAAAHVLAYLNQHGPSKTPDIIKNPKNCSSDQVRNAIYKLVKQGLIRRINTQTRGQTAVYALIQ